MSFFGEWKFADFIENIMHSPIVLSFATLVILAVSIIFIVKNRKHLRIKKITFGPIEVEKAEDSISPVYRIAILRHPKNVSGNPAALNTLIVRVYDREGNALKNKCVSISLEGRDNNPKHCISGALNATSDDNGEAVFSGLSISSRGDFFMVFHADGVTAKTRPFCVSPPGLDSDPTGKLFGSKEYIEALWLAISENKGGDKVTMDGEEIL